MEILDKIVSLLPVVSQVFMVVAILATIVVRLTPSERDDADASKAVAVLLKILRRLPTVGINPGTKKLEEAYEDLIKAKK